MSDLRPVKFGAVVLAAGHSIRMRRDKALLELEGRPMWQRQRDLLARAGAAELWLSARSDQPWAETAEGFTGLVRDASLDTGPLGGIAAALERTAQGHLAVLAVDLPRMEARWFERLAAECTPGCGVAGRSGKFFEPLAAIYPRELAPLAQAALEDRVLSLQKLIAAGVAAGLMRAREIEPADAAFFANWNEPGALDPAG